MVFFFCMFTKTMGHGLIGAVIHSRASAGVVNRHAGVALAACICICGLSGFVKRQVKIGGDGVAESIYHICGAITVGDQYGNSNLRITVWSESGKPGVIRF